MALTEIKKNKRNKKIAFLLGAHSGNCGMDSSPLASSNVTIFSTGASPIWSHTTLGLSQEQMAKTDTLPGPNGDYS